jgi:hypothetical protein
MRKTTVDRVSKKIRTAQALAALERRAPYTLDQLAAHLEALRYFYTRENDAEMANTAEAGVTLLACLLPAIHTGDPEPMTNLSDRDLCTVTPKTENPDQGTEHLLETIQGLQSVNLQLQVIAYELTTQSLPNYATELKQLNARIETLTNRLYQAQVIFRKRR